MIAGFATALLVGWQNPATSHTILIPIDAPADFVWKQFENFNNNKKWIEGYKTMEIVSGFPGQTGSEYVMHLELGGSELEVHQTLTSLEPGHRIELDTKSSFGKGVMIFEVHERPNGRCEIEVFTRLVGGDALSCALNKAMHSSAKQMELENYKRFKQLVERKFAVQES